MAIKDEAASKTGVKRPSGAKRDRPVSAPGDAPSPKAEAAREEPHPMPGLELLGRGIYLKPRQPYELKQRLVEPEKSPVPRTVFCAETGKSYLVPIEFEVNHSPPMPANQTLKNQTVVEQSWESLASHFQVDAKVAAGIGAFSLTANSSHIGQLRSSEEAYYALRTSFLPTWTVDFTGQPEVAQLHDALKTINTQIRLNKDLAQRRDHLKVLGEDAGWMYDLPYLLSKQTKEDLAETDLSELRNESLKLVPAELRNEIPDPLTAEGLDDLRTGLAPLTPQDPGYPKYLAGSYVEDWNIFD